MTALRVRFEQWLESIDPRKGRMVIILIMLAIFIASLFIPPLRDALRILSFAW